MPRSSPSRRQGLRPQLDLIGNQPRYDTPYNFFVASVLLVISLYIFHWTWRLPPRGSIELLLGMIVHRNEAVLLGCGAGGCLLACSLYGFYCYYNPLPLSVVKAMTARQRRLLGLPADATDRTDCYDEDEPREHTARREQGLASSPILDTPYYSSATSQSPFYAPRVYGSPPDPKASSFGLDRGSYSATSPGSIRKLVQKYRDKSGTAGLSTSLASSMYHSPMPQNSSFGSSFSHHSPLATVNTAPLVSSFVPSPSPLRYRHSANTTGLHAMGSTTPMGGPVGMSSSFTHSVPSFTSPIPSANSHLGGTPGGFGTPAGGGAMMWGSPSPYATPNARRVEASPSAYATSLPDAPEPTSTITTKLDWDDPKTEILIAEKAQWLLERLHIADRIDQWSDNIRTWFCRAILQPRVDALHDSNQKFLAVAQQLAASQQAALVQQPEIRKLLTSKTATPKLIKFISSQFPNESLVKRRVALDKYLGAGDHVVDMEYSLQRLTELAKSDYLLPYKWDGGGDWRGQSWKHTHLPNDTQLLLHVFCVFMDRLVDNFTKRHFCGARAAAGSSIRGSSASSSGRLRLDKDTALGSPRTGSATKSKRASEERNKRVTLVQHRVQPPLFTISHPHGVWMIKPGRMHFFHSLVLFFHYVRTELHGRLAGVSITDKNLMDLHRVFEDY